MQKVFLAPIICLLFPFSTYSQSYNKTNANGKKEGAWYKTFPNSATKRYEGQFKNGVPYGEFTFYYSSGKVKSKSTYVNGGMNIHAKIYHENGNLMGKGKYVGENLKDSTWLMYNPAGNLNVTESFLNGKLNGPSIVHYPKGDTAEITYYKESKKNGKWIQFFTDGKKKVEGTYANGHLNGRVTHYHPDGYKLRSGFYKYGAKENVWVSFLQNGVISAKNHYRKNKLFKVEEMYETGELMAVTSISPKGKVLRTKEYHKNGKLKADGKYYKETSEPYLGVGEIPEEGKQRVALKDSTWVYYDTKGIKKKEENYKLGKLHGPKTSFYPNGNIEQKFMYSDGLAHGIYIKMHPGGNTEVAGKYILDKKEGSWFTYNTDSTLVASEVFFNNQLQGEKTLFFGSGKKSEIFNYVNGNKHGIWKQFFDEGGIKSEGAYYGNYLNGVVKHYYPNGKIKTKGNFEKRKKEGAWIEYNENGEETHKNYYKKGKKLQGQQLEQYLKEIKKEEKKSK